jgi:hypothetical protein
MEKKKESRGRAQLDRYCMQKGMEKIMNKGKEESETYRTVIG